MPSDESLLQKAEEYKSKGNEAFGKGSIDDAISAYSQGLVACDRLAAPTSLNLKATLLSNRAMCYLKTMKLKECVDDCTTALNLQLSEEKLHSKLLYRRAKARFLLANLKQPADHDLLQDSAKDLLSLLQTDPQNTDANQLLATVRAQHKSTAATPVSKTLQALQQEDQKSDVLLHHVKVLLGMLDNDVRNTSMELGRLKGVQLLLDLSQKHHSDNPKLAVLSLQCLSAAGSHPPFVRDFLVESQKDLSRMIASSEQTDLVVSTLAILVRIILHADRDDPSKTIEGTTKLDYKVIMEAVTVALKRFNDKTVIRAVLDLLCTFTAGTDRDTTIRISLGGVNDPTLPVPKTQGEIRGMTPHELAEYRKREYEKKTRDEAWAYERSMLFCNTQDSMKAFLQAAIGCEDHIVRREMTVVLGRLLAAIEDEDRIKNVVKPYLANPKEEHEGVVIEEIYNEDDEEKQAAEEEEVVSLETKMERALITSALLLSKKDIGAWALGTGWKTSSEELPALIDSGDSRAMCLASEVLAAAATVESARHIVANLTSSGAMEKLLMSSDRDVRSGAASAVAKLGLSDKAADDAEIIGLLQAASDLLEEDSDEEPPTKDEGKLRHFSSFATSSVERAIEMITYLIGNTYVKDELAAGFQSRPDAKHTTLERLVKTADLPNAGESLSGFGLATIFQYMAVTNLELRKEGFEGKEVTMEQYDEMQKLGKTEEEKELMDAKRDPDTQDACNERIRKMASANVPRAMVTLMEGASEHTLEQLVMGMNRMANEPSVRGVMIQQGILSSCIKVEKNEGPTETDTMKKTTRLARHCIAKLLVTMNPSLLTSAQRLGAIRPLIQLIRDINSSDLQKFESLLAVTNIASTGDDAKNRIVSEKGISTLHFAMFSDHEMVRRAATEAMCNLVPHKAMMDHLVEIDHLKLWLAFAADYEDPNYECARAAAGCLAMATQDEPIALKLIDLEKFRAETSSLLESGRLEIMHRGLVIVLNLISHGGETRAKAISEGLVAFCAAYVDTYKTDLNAGGLEFSEEEKALLPVTVDLAKKIVQVAGEKES